MKTQSSRPKVSLKKGKIMATRQKFVNVRCFDIHPSNFTSQNKIQRLSVHDSVYLEKEDVLV